MKFKTWLCVVATALTVLGVNAQEDKNKELIDRIKPAGEVRVAGESASGDAAGGGGPRSGEDIYNSACVACHGSGVMGAPKHQVAADWQPRLDERGMDGIWENAINGINAMPPRGTCGDCSDEEIKSAIEYMTQGI